MSTDANNNEFLPHSNGRQQRGDDRYRGYRSQSRNSHENMETRSNGNKPKTSTNLFPAKTTPTNAYSSSSDFHTSNRQQQQNSVLTSLIDVESLLSPEINSSPAPIEIIRRASDNQNLTTVVIYSLLYSFQIAVIAITTVDITIQIEQPVSLNPAPSKTPPQSQLTSNLLSSSLRENRELIDTIIVSSPPDLGSSSKERAKSKSTNELETTRNEADKVAPFPPQSADLISSTLIEVLGDEAEKSGLLSLTLNGNDHLLSPIESNNLKNDLMNSADKDKEIINHATCKLKPLFTDSQLSEESLRLFSLVQPNGLVSAASNEKLLTSSKGN